MEKCRKRKLKRLAEFQGKKDERNITASKVSSSWKIQVMQLKYNKNYQFKINKIIITTVYSIFDQKWQHNFKIINSIRLLTGFYIKPN